MSRRLAAALIAIASLLGSRGAGAQASPAPPNPQQRMCIEALADTPEEVAWAEAIGEAPDTVTSLEELADWVRTRAIAKYGSEDAARAAGEKAQHEKYTQRIGLLRKAASAGHLPSLFLLADFSAFEEYRDVPGAMGAEERASARRALHEHGFPLVLEMLHGECLEAFRSTPEPEPPQPAGPTPKCNRSELTQVLPDTASPTICIDEETGLPARRRVVRGLRRDTIEELAAEESRRKALRAAQEAAQEALKAQHLAEHAAKRGECLALLREGGFRGDTRAWERLADYDITHPTPPEVGIVPPIEHYAWLELEKLIWREGGWEDRYSVPREHQERLVEEFLSEEDRREAEKLAARFAEVLWPRRINLSTTGVCQVRPQFTSDPDPYGSNLSPR